MNNYQECIPAKPPFPVVVLYARDWCSYAGERPLDYPFTAHYTWLSGQLIREDDAVIVLCQDYCPATMNVRETWVIPKNTILYRFDIDNFSEKDGVHAEKAN